MNVCDMCVCVLVHCTGQDVTAALDETASALAVSEKAEGELRSRTSHMETQIAAQNDELEELRPVCVCGCDCDLCCQAMVCLQLLCEFVQMKSGYDTVKASAVKYEAAYNGKRGCVVVLCTIIDVLLLLLQCYRCDEAAAGV